MSQIPVEAKVILSARGRTVFFVGAGISKDPPSGFPLGAEFSSALVGAVCEGDSLLSCYSAFLQGEIARNLPGYRPEILLDLVRQGAGNLHLEVLRCLDGGDPNLYHCVLALAAAHGHIVVTTNFDCMIEQAYRRIIGSVTPLTVILTERDWNAFVKKQMRSGLLFKAHGSIREWDGRPSYQTIQAALATMSNGLTPWKRAALTRLFADRNVVFLGYSGNDDFDIGPFLTQNRSSGRYLWSRHSQTPLQSYRSRELGTPGRLLTHIDQMIANKGNSFVVEGNTSELLTYLPYFHKASLHCVPGTPRSKDWKDQLREVLSRQNLSLTDRTRYVGKILQYNGYLPDAERCLARNTRISKGVSLAVALDDLGQCHFLQRHFDADLLFRRRARAVARNSPGPVGMTVVGRTWLGAGESYRNLGSYGLAVRCFRKARSMYHRLGHPDKVGYCIAGLGGVYRMTARFGEARKAYQQASMYFRKGDDLPGLIYARWGLGEVWKCEGSFGRSLRTFREVRAWAEKCGHPGLAAWGLWGEAEISRVRWDLKKACELYTRACDTFPNTDIAGRSWAREGRAQCKILSGDDPTDDIHQALAGFTQLRAKQGRIAVLLDKSAYAVREGRLAEVEGILRDPAIQRPPPKEKGHRALITGLLHELRGVPGSKRWFDYAADTYRYLGMRHARVAVAILRALQQGCLSATDRRGLMQARRLALSAGYMKELEALRAILSGSPCTYAVNLY